ncbi:LacI family DNA-binding transcriptional regulator [Salana multivorans]|nr:LacI family DNA-binding transcriptional regulator [Salana multivorans]
MPSPSMPRPATSKDVARLAGVSQTTVSYVLRGTGRISPQTRRRVEEACETLHYRPNLAAQSMRTGRTGRLAILTATPGISPGGLLSAAAAATVAVAERYAPEIRVVAVEPELRAESVHDVLGSGSFEGILSFIPLDLEHDPTRARVVVMSEAFDDQMRVTDERIGAQPVRRLMSGLAARGHRRFLHLAGDLEYLSARKRRDAYLAAVAELGLTDLGVHECGWSGERTLEVVRSIGPDLDLEGVAVVAANDILASAAIRGLLERGVRVPDHAVVTGWDDMPTSAFQVPALTTVGVDFAAFGAWAMRTLIARVRDEPEPADPGELQRIHWRESTGDVPEGAPHPPTSG